MSELPQVYELWLGVSKGMLLFIHLAPKIHKIMAVNHCEHQLDRRLGWVAPAYRRKGGATPHPGACSMTESLMGALECVLGRGI